MSVVCDAIQSSHPLSSPFPPAFNLAQHQGLFQWVSSSYQVASVLPKNTQDWSPSEWTGWISLQSKGLSRVFSNTTVQKHQFFGTQPFFVVQLSLPYMTTGKTVALTIWTFAGIVMSLLFNTLSRLVIAFLPRSKHLFISWLLSPSAVILEPKKIKSVSVSIVSSSICHEVLGPGAMIPIWPMGITLFLLQWVSNTVTSNSFGWFFPWLWMFSSHTCTDQHSWLLDGNSADLWGFFSLCAALLSILKPMNFNCLGLLGFQLCLL